MTKHGFGNLEVGDDAVLHGPNRHDVAGRTTEHLLGFGSHGQHGFSTARILLDRNDRGLGKHDTLALDVDKRVRRTEVDGEIVGERSDNLVEQATHLTPVPYKKRSKFVSVKALPNTPEVR